MLCVNSFVFVPDNDYATRIIEKSSPGASVDIEIKRAFPRHISLGSGTQLAMATGVVVNRALSLNIAQEDIASILGRGKRSGTGYWGFLKGGLVVDGGSLAPQ